jgi:hypothetical protein
MSRKNGSRRAGKSATALSEAVTITAAEDNRPPESTQEHRRQASPSANNRPLFRLVLRPQPRIDGERALRALLKTALRRFGLRCLSVERVRL